MGKNNLKTVVMQYQLQVEELKRKLENIVPEYNPKKITSKYKQDYSNMLQIKDEILATNRYIWKNLPYNITSQQMESFLYNYGNILFFVKDNKLKIAQYSAKGTLNEFGILTEVQPIGFDGKSYDYKINVQNYNEKEKNKVGVICNDYTTIGNFCIPRRDINKNTTIKDETEVYAQIITNVKVSVHKAIALCDNQNQADFVRKQVSDILSTDMPIATFAGDKDDLGKLVNLFNINTTYDPQPFTNLIDYYNRVRRRNMGVPSPDTFEKKERLLSQETEMTHADNEILLLDGYYNRLKCVENMKKYLDFDGLNDIEVEINPNIYPENVGVREDKNGDVIIERKEETENEIEEKGEKKNDK